MDANTVARTPNPECYFCLKHRRHITDDIGQADLHPYRGHGYTKETGWSHDDLKPQSK